MADELLDWLAQDEEETLLKWLALDKSPVRKPAKAYQLPSRGGMLIGPKPPKLQPKNLSEALIYEEAGRSLPSQFTGQRYIAERIPFVGHALKAGENLKLAESLKRIRDGAALPRDWTALAHEIKEAEKQGDKGRLRKVMDIASAIPAFGIEFMATGGAFKTGQAAMGAAAKTLGGKALQKSAGYAAGSALQTAANPQLIAEEITRRLIPRIENLSVDDAGQLQAIIAEDDESFVEAIGKGTLSAVIEFASERAGAALDFIPGAKGAKAAVLKRFLSKPGNNIAKVTKTMKAAGWNGIIGEVFEERVGEVARGVTGVEKDYGVTGQLATDPTNLQAWEQLGIEAAAFAIPGAAGAAVGRIGGAGGQEVQLEPRPPMPPPIPEPVPVPPEEPKAAPEEPKAAPESGQIPGEEIVPEPESQEAKESRLVQEHEKLVRGMAERLAARNPGVEADDLFQAGQIGLLNAIRKFDPSQGAKLSTYATPAIRNAMLDALGKGPTEQQAPEGAEEQVAAEPEEPPAEEAERLEAALDSLQEEDVDLLSRTYGLRGRQKQLQGEIAEELEVSPQAVSKRLEGARKRLKEARKRLEGALERGATLSVNDKKILNYADFMANSRLIPRSARDALAEKVRKGWGGDPGALNALWKQLRKAAGVDALARPAAEIELAKEEPPPLQVSIRKLMAPEEYYYENAPRTLTTMSPQELTTLHTGSEAKLASIRGMARYRELVEEMEQNGWSWQQDDPEPVMLERDLDGTLEMVDGNHRVAAALDAGIKKPVPVVIINISDKEDVIAQFNLRLKETDVVPLEEAPGAIDKIRREQPTPKTDMLSVEKPPAEVKPKEPRYSSTQVNLPRVLADRVKRLAGQIAEEDLAEDGREEQPHITVKYGLHTDAVEDVRSLVESEPPIRVTFGKTSVFPASESGKAADVVKVDVESEDLRRLNEKIADALETTETRPGYQPHVTLGYVKPGLGDKYAGRSDLEGQELVLDRIVFSDKDKKHTEIELKGKRSLGEKAEARPPVTDKLSEQEKLESGSAVEDAIREMTLLHEDAWLPENTYEQIRARVDSLGKQFTKPQVVEIAQGMGIPGSFETKKEAIEEIHRRIAGFKQSRERVQFGGPGGLEARVLVVGDWVAWTDPHGDRKTGRVMNDVYPGDSARVQENVETRPKPMHEVDLEDLETLAGPPKTDMLSVAAPGEPAQEAQRAAEGARSEIEYSGFVGGGRSTGERIRPDKIPEAIKSPNEEAERRLQKAKGLRRRPLKEKVRKISATIKNVVTRAQEHLPNTGELAAANEFFRLLKNVPVMAQDEAIRATAAIVDPLGPNQLELFNRAAVTENQVAALEMGQPLRFGFMDKQEVEAYRDQLQEAIDATPEVQEARETRQKIINETVDKLIEYGLLSETAKENTNTYYHQQVHFYMEAERRMSGGERPGKVSRGFQRPRVKGESLDEKFDYNTNYIEAEISWLTDAYVEIEKERLLRDLMKKYDIKPELKDQAKQLDSTWESLANDKEGYDIFQPEPGNAFYQAFTIPDRIVEALQQDAFESANLSKDDLRQVLSIGAPHRQFVVPTELATQLDAAKERDIPHGLVRLSDEAMKAWKVWTLLNPKRAVGYNLRNLSGDLDVSVAANPLLLKHTPRAMRELQKYHGSRLALSGELRKARDLGVVSSGFAAEEVPDLKDLAVFQRFFSQSEKPKFGLRLISGYFDTVKQYTEFRENTLRYAAFLSALEQIKRGRITHYGGSRKQVVDQLRRDMGPDVAAAHLARNLLGDYGNITVMGNWIRRRLMPFWSFQEINLKRTPRLVINAWESGKTWDAVGGLSKAAAGAVLTSRLAWMYGALWTWNNLVMPLWSGDDDEEDLPPYDRANPHILLGRNADGSVRVFRNVGALGDFLEWFGLNEAASLIKKYRHGQIDVQEIVKEMMLAAPEKAFGALRPDVTGLLGVATGQSYFPEPFQPRTTRRGEAAANIFGLADEYKQVRGMILEDGSRARRHYWQRWVVGVVDPRQTALSEMYDLRNRFLKQKGSEDKGIYPVSRYKEARDAAKNEDYDAFVEWKLAFIKDFGKEKAKDKFKGFLRRIDPIASRLTNANELEFEQEFLTSEQRGQLQVARQYAGELHDLLLTWWDAAERSGNAVLVDEVMASLAASIAGPKDVTALAVEERVAFDRAVDALTRFGISRGKLGLLLMEKMKADASKKGTVAKNSTLAAWRLRLDGRLKTGD